MDFVERIFDVAPDAGSGAYEVFLLLALLAIAALGVRHRMASRKN